MNGLLPILKLVDASMSVVDSGLPKRPGGVTVYVEIWHADLLEMINIRRMATPESKSARGIYHGLVVPDLL
jgi:ribonucleotide reductase alpha subunit